MMNFVSTNIPDVKIIEPTVYGDERGFFMESFRQDLFEQHCGHFKFVQENHSKSVKNVLRGLHYQTCQQQGKLVRVTTGCVYDVAVDMRKNSSTLGKWIGVELSADNKKQLWVPPGFAHGFIVLSDVAEFVYKCTDFYHPESEVSVIWDDVDLNIAWPISDGQQPTLSAKDQQGLSFQQAPKL